jgi:glycosyltransferase involved in cell wall biosynthesis
MNSSPHVLILTQYFPPEAGAAASRMSDYALLLKEAGFKVSVVCERPAYFVRRNVKSSNVESWNGIQVYRSWVIVNKRSTNKDRSFFYLSFMLSGIIRSLLIDKPNVIWVTSPPLTTAVAGRIISRLRRVPYILDVRDLWPDSVIELDAMKNRFFIRILEGLEQWVYKGAKVISLAVPGFRERISGKIKRTPDFVDLPNGVPDFMLDEYARPVFYQNTIEGKFVVLFSGNMGIAQGLDRIIDAAKLLSARQDIMFVFVGDGVKKAELEKEAAKAAMKNIHFVESQARSEMPSIISAAHVGLVPLKNVDLFTNALPSKMFEYLARKVPLVTNIPGEAADFIRRNQCGIVLSPDHDAEELARVLSELADNREKCKAMGQSGYMVIRETFTRKFFVHRLIHKIQTDF